MVYTYQGTLEEFENEYLITFPQFNGCFGGGETIVEACENASITLQLFIAMYLDDKTPLPEPVFGNPPQCIFTVEVTDEFIATSKCITIEQAADELEVSIAVVNQLITCGNLETYNHNDEQLVTIASMNTYKVLTSEINSLRESGENSQFQSNNNRQYTSN